MKIRISGCGLVAGVLMLSGLPVVAEVVDCVETRPDAMEFNVLNSHTLEAPDCEFGIVNYTPSWNGIELKNHFRLTGGWTRLDDGRVKGDIRLECTNACELVVLSFTANFRMTPVVGREWMADDVARVLPVKQSKNIFLGAGRARAFLFPLADGKMLRAEFEQPVEYRAQDSRQWGPRWGLRMGGCQERRIISPGETFEFKVVLSVAGGMRLTVPAPWTLRESEQWAQLDYRKDPAACSVYELDTAGNRVGTVPSEAKDGALAFDVSTRGPRGGRIYYEIAKTLPANP